MMSIRALLSKGSVIWGRGIKTCAAKVDNVTVRSASFKDLSVYRQICEEQNWILGKHDLELLFAADPTGYYVGELDGQAMSMFSAIKYGNVCCFGAYGVLQKFQNKWGIHLQFNRLVREKVFESNTCASIFMTTVMEPFVLKNLSRYKVYRGWVEYEFTYKAKKAAGLSLPDPRIDIKLEPYQDTNFKKLFNYDKRIFGHARRLFLEELVGLSSCTNFIATHARSREIVGYCTIRETNDDDVCYLSPWYANDAEIAQQLLKKAALFVCECNPNVKFRSIMPDLNKDGLQIMHRLAPQVKDYKKLFVGNIPDNMRENSKNRVFAISSPCLG